MEDSPRTEADVLGDVCGGDVEAGLAGEVGRRSAEDRGAELVQVAVRDAEAELCPADDGNDNEVEGKQSAIASSL